MMNERNMMNEIAWSDDRKTGLIKSTESYQWRVPVLEMKLCHDNECNDFDEVYRAGSDFDPFMAETNIYEFMFDTPADAVAWLCDYLDVDDVPSEYILVHVVEAVIPTPTNDKE